MATYFIQESATLVSVSPGWSFMKSLYHMRPAFKSSFKKVDIQVWVYRPAGTQLINTEAIIMVHAFDDVLHKVFFLSKKENLTKNKQKFI